MLCRLKVTAALSKPAQDRVLAELQFDLCHFDSTLVVGDHHRSKYDQQSVPFGYGDDVLHHFDKRVGDPVGKV